MLERRTVCFEIFVVKGLGRCVGQVEPLRVANPTEITTIQVEQATTHGAVTSFCRLARLENIKEGASELVDVMVVFYYEEQVQFGQ